MSHDFEARARRAADNLKATVAGADLTAIPPGTKGPHRALTTILRPAWVAVLLLIGSAAGLALVLEPSPPAATILPAPPSTVVTTTTLAPTTTEATTPPTSAAVAPPSTEAPADTAGPSLQITSPRDGEEFEEKTVTFTGSTEPGARVFAGRYEAEVDPQGHWQIVLVLNDDGATLARFVARDSAGNETEAAVTVYFVAPTTTTTKPKTTTTEKVEEEPEVEFTAHATFGSCSETPPYDVYYGTGKPGSLVEIVSEYGSASVEVGPEGHWEKKVIFETAPPDVYFLVKAKDQFGHKAEFEFVYQP